MQDPIETILPRLRRHLSSVAHLFPLRWLDIIYKGNLYPIILPDHRLNSVYPKVVDRLGRYSDLGRPTIMANILMELKNKWFVICLASEDKNEFVQYRCFRHPFTSLPDDPVIMTLIRLRAELKLEFLYPKCYMLNFPRRRNKKGREETRAALEIAKEYGFVPYAKYMEELKRTNEYPKTYIIKPTPDKKFNDLDLYCGADPWFAAKMGHEILRRVFGNSSPIRADFGEFS